MSRPSDPGFGALFSANPKPGTQQPAYRGNVTCCHCSAPMQVAGWKKTSAKGVTYLSLKLQPEGEGREQAPKKGTDDDPSCPF